MYHFEKPRFIFDDFIDAFNSLKVDTLQYSKRFYKRFIILKFKQFINRNS